MELCKKLFWTSRPVSWINTAYPFAVAYFLTVENIQPVLVYRTLFFLIPYNLLMYGVNDVFDYESDLKNPRKGGIEGSILSTRWHKPILWSSVICSLPFVVAMMLAGTLQSNLVLAFVLFMVVAYSAKHLRFKEIPFLDSITSSIHFVGPMVYALVLTGWNNVYWPYVVSFLLWGMASHAFGAVQDVIPDREGGIDSIATKCGARFTVWFSSFMYCMSGLLLLFQPWPAPIVGLCSWLYLTSTLPYSAVNDVTSARTHTGWRRFMKLNMLSGFVITILIIFAN